MTTDVEECLEKKVNERKSSSKSDIFMQEMIPTSKMKTDISKKIHEKNTVFYKVNTVGTLVNFAKTYPFVTLPVTKFNLKFLPISSRVHQQ